jgi:hypothetical protein
MEDTQAQIRARLMKIANEMDTNGRDARVERLLFTEATSDEPNQFDKPQEVLEEEFDRKYAELMQKLADNPSNTIAFRTGGTGGSYLDGKEAKGGKFNPGDDLTYAQFMRYVSDNREEAGIDPNLNFISQVSRMWNQYKKDFGLENRAPRKRPVKKLYKGISYKDFVRNVTANKDKYNIDPKKNMMKQIGALWREYKKDNGNTIGGKFIEIQCSRKEPIEKRVSLVNRGKTGGNYMSKKDKQANIRFNAIIKDLAKEISAEDADKLEVKQARKKFKPEKSELKKELEIITSKNGK